MKKAMLALLVVMLIILTVTACGGGGSARDERTITDFLQAFEDNGFDTSDRQTPFFQMIGANDGMQFIIDGQFHTIYSFAGTSELEQAFADHPFMETQGWITNGRFVIETNSTEIGEFFRTIE